MVDYKTQSFKEGEIIINEGDEPQFAYIIKTGTARVFKKRSNGSEALISNLKAGDIIGEMSLIDSVPRSASVMATDNVEVIIIDQVSFDKSLESLDNFASRLVKTLVKRLRILDKQVADLSEPFNMLKAAEKGHLTTDKTHTKYLFVDDQRDKLHLEAIKTLVVTKNSQTRQSIKGGMHMQGFREIADCSNAVDFRSLCAMNAYDLIYVDCSIGVDEASSIINDIRHEKTNVSPFCVIFAALENPDTQTLEKFADSGLDDILVKPVTIGNIIDRVEKRVRSRKPFVVTINYVGPDRRSNPRPGKEVIPLVHVPNPVSFKALSNIEPNEFQKMEKTALSQIEKLKIERHAVQIEWLCNKIKSINEEKLDPSFFLKRTREVSKSLVNKLVIINDEVHIGVCNRMITMIDDFEAGMAEMDGGDWNTFTTLATNLKLNLGPKLQP